MVGFDCPAASPTISVSPSTNFLIGPFIQIGAKIFLIIEKSPLDFKNPSITSAEFISFPETPTLPTPSPEGIIHSKNPGYLS